MKNTKREQSNKAKQKKNETRRKKDKKTAVVAEWLEH